MIQQVSSVKHDLDHEKKWGGFNDFPPNWREIGEKEFAQSHFFTYTPKFVEYRQMLERDERGLMKIAGKCVSAFLYLYDDGVGYAIQSDYWGGKVHYYRFGCDHSYRAISSDECRNRNIYHGGKCFHVSECTKCGYIHAVDSSD